MRRLAGLLLREGLALAAGNELRKSLRHLSQLAAYYSVVAIFAVAAVAFLYVLIYNWLTVLIDAQSAAAILFGANLAIAGLMLLLRKAVIGRKATVSPPLGETIASPALAAGVAIGQNIGVSLRKATPQIMLGAAVLGLIIGMRPQVIGWARKDKDRAPQKRR